MEFVGNNPPFQCSAQDTTTLIHRWSWSLTLRKLHFPDLSAFLIRIRSIHTATLCWPPATRETTTWTPTASEIGARETKIGHTTADGDERDNNKTNNDRKGVLLQVLEKLARVYTSATYLAITEKSLNSIYCINPYRDAIIDRAMIYLSRSIEQNNLDYHDYKNNDDDTQSQSQT